MNWTLAALILCSLAALGWTKTQQCCTPPKWSGTVEVRQTVGGRPLPVETNSVKYDYTNKRSYNLITRFNNSQTPPFHQFKMYIRYDDNVGMFYFLDTWTGKCVKKHITGDFAKECTPKSNATLDDEYLGVRGGYRVHQWASANSESDQTLLVQPVDEAYTGAECYPVLWVNEGLGDKGGSQTTAIYKYFETGIRDESVFDLPKECQDAQKVNQLPFDYNKYRTIFRR